MKKQILLFVLMLLPMVASADDSGKCGENVNYTYVEATHTLTISGTGAMYDFQWDYSLQDYATPWVSYKKDIISVFILDGVTSIGDHAFRDCSGLSSVTIPNSVTSIGICAFYDCSGLTSVTIPNSVTSIGGSAFYKCSGLTSVTIPNSVTIIEGSAFYHCSELRSVTIGNSVTYIGSMAFSRCSGLKSVTIPNNVTYISDLAFSDCSGLTSVTIGNSVTYIGYQAFSDCRGLISVYITDLEAWCKIKYSSKSGSFDTDHALYLNGEEIKDFVIPNSVTSIGNFAFQHCSGLTSVTFPNSVTSIGNYSFYGCSGLTSVDIPNSVTSIGQFAFCACSGLNSVNIPNSVISIGEEAFRGCSGLMSVHITDLESWCSITFGDFLANPLSYANHLYLGGEEIKDLIIPKSVTSISGWSFYNCRGLTSVTIPNSVTSIGWRAFQYCSGLTSVTIGSSVKKIYSQAFAGCSNLETVKCLAETVPNTSTAAFQDSDPQNANLFVPTGSLNAYENTVPWSYFGTLKALDEGAGIETPHSALPMILGQGGVLTVQGADDGTKIGIYNINGTLAGEGTSRNGCATVNTNLQPGSVAIIKIGDRSVKVVIK